MANASTTAVRAKARTMGLFMASFSILVTYAHNSTHDQTHSMLRILDRTNNFRNGLDLMTENLTHSGIKSEFARDDTSRVALPLLLKKYAFVGLIFI
jgi:hypothetical protein